MMTYQPTMSYLVEPMNFVKGKKSDAVEEKEARAHRQKIKRKQANAGNEAREFYESVIAEPPVSQKNTSGVKLEEDDCHCQLKSERGNTEMRCKSSKPKLPASNYARSYSSSYFVQKPRSDQNLNKLLRFCQEGNLREIRKTLKKGDIDLDATDNFGWNALMCAAYSGHVHAVKYLAKKHPIGLQHRNKQGQTIVELAHRAGQDEVVKALEQMEREASVLDHQTRNYECPSGSRQPIWCEKCESDFKDEMKIHQCSTAHLFSCGHGPQPTHYHLPESNRGFQMMLQGGWDKEKGLGKEGEGHKFPVKTTLKRDRQGLGLSDSDVKPRITHFKPFDTDAVKKQRKERKKDKKEEVNLKDTKRTRYSKSCRDKAMEINFRISFHSQP